MKLVYEVQFKHNKDSFERLTEGSVAPAVGCFVLAERDRSWALGLVTKISCVYNAVAVEVETPSIYVIAQQEAEALSYSIVQAEEDGKLFCYELIRSLGLPTLYIVDVEIHADFKKVIIRYVKPSGVGYVNFQDFIRNMRQYRFQGARIWLQDETKRQPHLAALKTVFVPQQPLRTAPPLSTHSAFAASSASSKISRSWSRGWSQEGYTPEVDEIKRHADETCSTFDEAISLSISSILDESVESNKTLVNSTYDLFPSTEKQTRSRDLLWGSEKFSLFSFIETK